MAHIRDDIRVVLLLDFALPDGFSPAAKLHLVRLSALRARSLLCRTMTPAAGPCHDFLLPHNGPTRKGRILKVLKASYAGFRLVVAVQYDSTNHVIGGRRFWYDIGIHSGSFRLGSRA